MPNQPAENKRQVGGRMSTNLVDAIDKEGRKCGWAGRSEALEILLKEALAARGTVVKTDRDIYRPDLKDVKPS